MIKAELQIVIVGLGYVGLPLAVEFGRRRNVIGFDTAENRVKELISYKDRTHEVSSEEIKNAQFLKFTSDIQEIKTANCYIITVPTPIDSYKKPDLSFLLNATEIVGKVLRQGDLVIYESTVYPGATEEDCVPLLEKLSGLEYNVGFFCGYSPERINPGDKKHKLTMVKKITAGSSPEVAEIVDSLYEEIIVAGTHKVKSIRIAEAAKVIENTQRDLNIALVNELAIIFNKMEIDTQAVLEAAQTKWNFIPFKPGLVGGHCIGVDPYYLAHKSIALGYHPDIILAGRKVNDNMGFYVVSQLLKSMMKRQMKIEGAKFLIMGLTFKENCADLRNTRVVDIIEELNERNCTVDVLDPLVKPEDAMKECNVRIIQQPTDNSYDGIVIAVAHKQFKELGVKAIRQLGKPSHILYDLKHIFSQSETDIRL